MIPKPLKRSVFFQTLQCIRIQRAKLEKLQEEKGNLDRQIRDAKLLNRAKLLLMQVLKLSEPQAHHYIEKQAMDLRISKREVAEGIINTYET
jgi:response regulator NasT